MVNLGGKEIEHQKSTKEIPTIKITFTKDQAKGVVNVLSASEHAGIRNSDSHTLTLILEDWLDEEEE